MRWEDRAVGDIEVNRRNKSWKTNKYLNKINQSARIATKAVIPGEMIQPLGGCWRWVFEARGSGKATWNKTH